MPEVRVPKPEKDVNSYATLLWRAACRKNLTWAALLLAGSLLAGEPAAESLPPAPTGKKWKLTWGDEFEGTKLDENKWNRSI